MNINLSLMPSIQIVWETFKVTCRGWIITYQNAMMICKAELQSIIHGSICTVQTPLLSIQLQMNKAFRDFYSKLYQKESAINEKDMESFFPTLKEEERESIEVPVTEPEIFSALKSFPTGKAPRNNGFTIDIFKCFQNNISPLLTLLFNDILTKHSMPLTMRQATISLLPKPGKDHSQMTNVCPISMLNNDYNLFAKICTMCMETAISTSIHIDQVGFIKLRLASNNMRRLLQVMATASSHSLTLDAEKAFDRVEWRY